VAFTDPFGTDSVTGTVAALQVYEDGKRNMANCAAGKGCNKSQASDAQAGLNVLAAAESDPTIMIRLELGKVTNQSSVGTKYTVGTTDVTITLDGSHNSITNHYFSLDGVAVHEVYEHFERFRAAGPYNPNSFGPARYPAHFNAVRFAEDPALLGAGRASRSSRSLVSGIDGQPDLPY
jgi:hypothetical protein